MESRSSKAVKLVLRLMKYKEPYTKYDLDIKRVRKDNISVPGRGMCKGCKIKEEAVGFFRIWHLTPKKLKNKKLIIYFHGGGFIEGMVKEQWNTIAKIAVLTGSKVLIPEYPLAPESNYRDVLAMVLETYIKALETTNAADVSFVGDSAGGGMLLSFAMLLRDEKRSLPSKLIVLSPWVDVTMTNPEMEALDKVDPMISMPGLKRAGEMYAGGSKTTDYLISPLYGNMTGLPPTYIFAGTHDILYPDAKIYADKSKAAGVDTYYYEYPKMVHGWMFLPIIEAKKAIKEIVYILAA
jgi:monoterpene epsilon-lactone hydrolase